MTLKEERDYYLARLNLLESAIEKMVPLAKYEELEAEIARLTQEQENTMSVIVSKGGDVTEVTFPRTLPDPPCPLCGKP
jgi:hypothetical protein